MSVKKRWLGLIGVLLLLIMVLLSGWGEVRAQILRVHPGFLLALLALQILTIGMIVYQWTYLLQKRSPQVSFLRTLAVYMAGSFVESVTPSVKFGGEAVKIVLFQRLTGRRYGELAGLMVLQKTISMLPFILISLVMLLGGGRWLPQMGGWRWAGLSVLLLIPGLYLVWRVAVSRWRALERKVRQFIAAVWAERKAVTLAEFMGLLALSSMVWALYPLKVYGVAWALGLEVSWQAVVLATFGAYIIGMLPLSPGSLGTFEGSMAAIFSQMGLAFSEGLAISLVTRLATFWFPLLLSGGFASWEVYRYLGPKSEVRSVGDGS